MSKIIRIGDVAVSAKDIKFIKMYNPGTSSSYIGIYVETAGNIVVTDCSWSQYERFYNEWVSEMDLTAILTPTPLPRAVHYTECPPCNWDEYNVSSEHVITGDGNHHIDSNN